MCRPFAILNHSFAPGGGAGCTGFLPRKALPADNWRYLCPIPKTPRRLANSWRTSTAHVKEFGDDITFVKLEDLDALVEAVELARNRAADWEEKVVINYAERTAMIQHIAELEAKTERKK